MYFYLKLRTVIVALSLSLSCTITVAESSTLGEESSTLGEESSTLGKESSTLGKESSPKGSESSTSAEEPSTPDAELQVYKSAQCGCCKKWMAHLALRDFVLHGHDTNELSTIKQQHGIAARYQSCHTAVSQHGFVFEGHVPARFIRSFLQNPVPDAVGLSVPGMPTGSPGMEMGQVFEPYAVLVLFKDGSSKVYAQVTTAGEQY